MVTLVVAVPITIQRLLFHCSSRDILSAKHFMPVCIKIFNDIINTCNYANV